MLKHLFYIIYIISIVCGSGWYILEQKKAIKEQEETIKELTVSQRPPVEPEKRKVQIVEKVVTKEVPVKGDCKEWEKKYTEMKNTALQCAYNLKFCQESSSIYKQMQPKPESDKK